MEHLVGNHYSSGYAAGRKTSRMRREKIPWTVHSFEAIVSYDTLLGAIDAFWNEASIHWMSQKHMASLVTSVPQRNYSMPMDEDSEQTKMNFRKGLLMRCQKEFLIDTAVLEARLNELKEERQRQLVDRGHDLQSNLIATTVDPDIYELWKKENQFIGNIRFVGELFKVDVVSHRIVQDVIARLLTTADRISLLSLCSLFHAVGVSCEVKLADSLDQYFKYMEVIRNRDEIDDGMKDLLDYFITWRKNDWILP